MIDIHCHIIPDFDDGANSLELSLELLNEAQNEGITDIICTPHYISAGRYKESYQFTTEIFDRFKNIVKKNNIDINLHLGNEIFINNDTDQMLEECKVHTLANTDYVLIELPWDKYTKEVEEWLYNISIAGFKIIIAHPERYDYVQQDYRIVKTWLDEGYLLQSNQNSLFKPDTKDVLNKLLSLNYIHFIASDAHNEYRRITLEKADRKSVV